jgi:hypothetical protein
MKTMIRFFSTRTAPGEHVLHVQLCWVGESHSLALFPFTVPEGKRWQDMGELVERLQAVQRELRLIYNREFLHGRPCNPADVALLYTQRDTVRFLLDAHDACFPREGAPELTRNHLVDFLAGRRQQDVELKKVNLNWVDAFEQYLLQFVSAARAQVHLLCLRDTLTYACELGVISRHPFQEAALPSGPEPVLAGELNRLIDAELADQELARLRDLYLFWCLSGVNYWELSPLMARGMNGAETRFSAEARQILSRYEGKLPQVAREKIPQLLAKLAAVLHIPQRLTDPRVRQAVCQAVTEKHSH